MSQPVSRSARVPAAGQAPSPASQSLSLAVQAGRLQGQASPRHGAAGPRDKAGPREWHGIAASAALSVRMAPPGGPGLRVRLGLRVRPPSPTKFQVTPASQLTPSAGVTGSTPGRNDHGGRFVGFCRSCPCRSARTVLPPAAPAHGSGCRQKWLNMS
jgi:hypothetical protein